MSLRRKITVLFLSIFLPLAVFAVEFESSSGVRLGASIFSVVNLALFVTAIVSIRQFFWPGYENRLPFHVVNIVLTVLFYAISLPFLISNRDYYVGYETLTPLGVLGRFFFTLDTASLAQWVIIFAFFCNIIYVVRNYRDYFQAGLVRDTHDDVTAVSIEEEVETDVDAIP